ncbi:MAG TPA: YetF domain-containing protein [Nakamurella sp.]|nr:YetF domain-containing protein [Nakamurella sp.]
MEIVYRAALIFFFLWMITRVVGRSTIGELSTFQLVLFITMGDMVQQAVTQQDYSVTAGVLAVSVLAVLTIGLSWANARWPRLRPITHGVPVVILQDGDPSPCAMRRERLSIDDLMAAARQQGYERLSDIKLAVLEANGMISFFSADSSGSESGREGAEEKPSVG